MTSSRLTALALLFVVGGCAPTFDYGAKKYEVKRLRANLVAQPCSKDAFVPLVRGG